MRWRPDPIEADDRDLGFGSEVAARARRRFLNPDGSFNVERHGLGWRASLSLYHQLITMSWPRFIGLVVLLYLLVNGLFAGAYVAVGVEALEGAHGGSFASRWLARDPERPDKRLFTLLPLERSKVSFFPLSWTVVHPIDDESPLSGLRSADLEAMDAEFLILLSGFDETFSQIVHTRSSYKAQEILWNVRFASMFETPDDDRPVAIDIGRIHDVESIDSGAG